MLTFNKDFTLQEPIPPKAVDKALEVLSTGRLHRVCSKLLFKPCRFHFYYLYESHRS